MRLRRILPVVAGALAGCSNLDLTNPNSPTEQAALSNLDGVIATE